MSLNRSFDLIVIGDEVESILTAVSAARAGARVAVVRRSTGWLGGLSTRGGLSYMDITWEFATGLFHEFLQKAGVQRVALNPQRANDVLAEMMDSAEVTLISGIEPHVEEKESGWLVKLSDGQSLESALLVDATPDADIARELGIPYVVGLGGLLGEAQDFLGFSPVFRIAGVPVPELQAFEASLRQRSDIRDVLSKALPYHPEDLRQEYVTRPTFAPDDEDYLDILNPVIGIYYHLWKFGEVESYSQAPVAIDGGNVSRLADGTLGFNGLVARPIPLDYELEDLIAFSHGAEIPEELRDEMADFERFLQEEGGLAKAEVLPPQELYVRQTVNLMARRNMTAREMIQGGVPAERAVGTFSYWVDLRGTQLWEKYPGEQLPKPVFNLSLDVTLPAYPQLKNFAFISRAAGYSPLGQGPGRIVQHNALLGEALGIACAVVALGRTTLDEVCEHGLPQVQEILRYRHPDWKPSGHPTLSQTEADSRQVLADDEAIVSRLRSMVAQTAECG